MLKKLSADQLPDVAGADDERALTVRRLASSGGARKRTHRGHCDDREQPKADQSPRARRVQPENPRGGIGEPNADGDEMEEVDELVDAGVRRALFVAIVEAIQLRNDDPRRNGGEEHPGLRRDTQALVNAAADESGDNDKCKRKSCDIGCHQEAADQPATPPAGGLGGGLER